MICFLLGCASPEPKINIWYGKVQQFGSPGNTQRWVNILGSVDCKYPVKYLGYSLNEKPYNELSIGPDLRRLADIGDFNIEIHRDSLLEGKNHISIKLVDSVENTIFEKVIVQYKSGSKWPLPYDVRWKDVEEIQDHVDVIDGKWKLTSDGIRTLEPYYDRVIAFGDASWKDYEVRTTVTFHSFSSPKDEPPTFGVSHAAIALRWPGHDYDEHQPHIKWHPLGATCEFNTSSYHDNWRWRMLKPSLSEDTTKSRKIQLNKPYHMVARVQSQNDTSSIYSAKLWLVGHMEPDGWDLVGFEPNDDVTSGSALLIAHHTDVTFGDIKVIPLDESK
jgi:hypothetical protein